MSCHGSERSEMHQECILPHVTFICPGVRTLKELRILEYDSAPDGPQCADPLPAQILAPASPAAGCGLNASDLG